MNLFLVGIILLKDILQTHLISAAPKNDGHTTHKPKNGHTTSKYHTTTMMEPIEYELHRDKLIPDLVDKAPEHVLKVVYEKDVTVCFGNTLRAAAAAEVPEKISWLDEDPKITFFTIIFTDLDVPSPENPVEREWQHWVIGNIPDNRIKAGQTLTEYIGPTPMHGNGTHRYAFQLFLQKQGKIHFEEMHIPARAKDFKRAQFSSREFAKKYALGRPYAVNYFLVTWPEEPESEEDEGTPMPPPPMPTGGDFDLRFDTVHENS